ncbi:MAG TPA: hypothetical protein VKA41_12245 [Solirubrobacterales bacterium]|nr:hypothetical protein [Solirubrobacterales bacterium]
MNRRTREHKMTDRDRIEIRLLGIEDGAALARLAELDTADAPPAPLLGGIAEGRLVAARSLATGQSIADPFQQTAEIRSLLAERASQVRGGRGLGLLSRLRQRLGGHVTAQPGRASEALR